MRRVFRIRDSVAKRFTALAILALVAALAGGCAKPTKIYRIGILIGTDSMKGMADGFRKRMAELGYAEGKNIVFDARASNADRAEEKRISEKFVADKVDLIYAFPGQPALAAKLAAKGTRIPVVFANAIIGGTDLIDSVRNPGGNISGVRIPNPELTLKTFETLIELAPRTRRILILYDPGYPTDEPILAALRAEAAASGVELKEERVADPGKIQEVLAALARIVDPRTDAIVLLPDTVARSTVSMGAVLAFANGRGVPLAGGPLSMVKEGVVLTAASDQGEQGELAATIADKILKGTPAGSIPVVTTKTDLIVNYRKARELGLDPPEGLLKQASEIIR